MTRSVQCLLFAGVFFLAACSSPGPPAMDPQVGFGPSPQLPAPHPQGLVPVVNVADAVGWPEGGKPAAAPGFQVAALAGGFDHPRWIYVLPNGDILVAETNNPGTDKVSGLRGVFMRMFMSRAGATPTSANRITLLRDADGDGVAEVRTTFLSGLYSPFGMALVGDTFYVANADALVAFPYQAGASSITAPPRRVADLPAGYNHHWTKSLVASPDGRRLYVGVGSNSNIGENGMEMEERRAPSWRSIRPPGPRGSSPAAFAIPLASTSTRWTGGSGPRSMNATSSATTLCRTT